MVVNQSDARHIWYLSAFSSKEYADLLLVGNDVRLLCREYIRLDSISARLPFLLDRPERQEDIRSCEITLRMDNSKRETWLSPTFHSTTGWENAFNYLENYQRFRLEKLNTLIYDPRGLLRNDQFTLESQPLWIKAMAPRANFKK